jgi:putative oxidoreductase
MNASALEAWAPQARAVLRIVTALLFIEHGTQKLFGFPASEFSPTFLSLPWIAGVLEIVGGGLVLVGFFTRPAAFVLSGLMAVAYWMVHAPQSFFPVVNAGDGAVLFCFVFLYIFVAGPGAWSVDAARAGRRI